MIIFASCGQHKIQCITLIKIFIGQTQPNFFFRRHYQLRDFEAHAYHLILTKHTIADYDEILCIYADTSISMFCHLLVFAIKTVEPWSSDCDFNIRSSNLCFVDPFVTISANWIVFIKNIAIFNDAVNWTFYFKKISFLFLPYHHSLLLIWYRGTKSKIWYCPRHSRSSPKSIKLPCMAREPFH